MKPSFSLISRSWISRPAAAGLVLALALLLPVSMLGQVDDFDDGNDDGWTRFDPRGLLGAGPAAIWSFPDGNSYRIQTPVIPDLNVAGQGRAASLFESKVYTDFYVEVDIIDWDVTSVQTAGILARVKEPDLGTLDGYYLNYDFGSGRDLSISLITDEASAADQLEEETGGPDRVDFHTGKDYRLVFIGRGSQLEGRVYELPFTDEPLVVITATDSTYSAGVCGLVVADNPAGENITDVTFDNYRAGPGPDRPMFPSDPPLVENIVPQNRSTFLSTLSQLSFGTRTVDPNTIDPNDIEVLLNGVNMSGSLTIAGNPTNRIVILDGLRPDRLYTAQITVSDNMGRTTVKTIRFDTVNPGTALMIEAEDYNYGLSGGAPVFTVCTPGGQAPPADSGGGFQDNPPPSGFESGALNQVNGNGVGYLDLVGVSEVDFHDASIAIGEEGINNYRLCNPVGVRKTGDVVRQKYLDLTIPDWDQDVFDIQAGEWLNYTRTFAEGNYRIVLRASSSAAQNVGLSRVTSNAGQSGQTTEALGTFAVPNIEPYYDYVELTDAVSGNPVTLALSGVQTLRLTALTVVGDLRLNYLLALAAEITLGLEDPRIEGGHFLFDFPTVNGIEYQVQTKSTLNDTWQNDRVVAGDGTTATVILPVTGEATFVQVVVP